MKPKPGSLSNKIDKPLSRLGKKRINILIIGIRNERQDTTTKCTKIKSIINPNYEQSYAKKLHLLGEMDKFLEGHKSPLLT